MDAAEAESQHKIAGRNVTGAVMLVVALATRIAFMLLLITGVSLIQAPADYIRNMEKHYAGRFGFLTYIGGSFTIIVVVLCIVQDLSQRYLGKYQENAKYDFLKDMHECKKVFLGLALPIETLILFLYWGLYFINNSLLTKSANANSDLILPLFTNLCLHLFPAVYLWTELLSFSLGLISNSYVSRFRFFFWASLSLVNVAYILWANFVYYKSSQWPYPLLALLGPLQQTALIFCTSLFCIVAFELAFKSNSLLTRHLQERAK